MSDFISTLYWLFANCCVFGFISENKNFVSFELLYLNDEYETIATRLIQTFIISRTKRMPFCFQYHSEFRKEWNVMNGAASLDKKNFMRIKIFDQIEFFFMIIINKAAQLILKCFSIHQIRIQKSRQNWYFIDNSNRCVVHST